MSKTYRTEIQCDNCGEWFTGEFDSPDETFSVTCPNCNAYFPEMYV